MALNETIDGEQIEEWTTAESNAMKKRLTDVTVMDIYDVKKAKGVYSQNALNVYRAHASCSTRQIPISVGSHRR